MTTLASPAVIRPVTPGDLSYGRYGKLGVSSTTDTQAWQDVFTDIVAKGGGRVTVPPGQFTITAPATITADMGTSELHGITVEGAGANCTTFKCDAGLFSWVQASARDIGFRMRDIGVQMVAGGNNGNIIYLEQVEGGLGRQQDVMIERVFITPADPTTDYYNNAITVKNFYFPSINEVYIANPFGPGVTTATQHQGQCGIRVDGCYGPRVTNSKVWGAARGLSHDVTANPGGESILIRGCVFDSDVGIYIASAGGEPGFDIMETHTNCATKGIHVVNKRLGHIRDSVLYHEESGAYVDIDLDDCEDVFIDNMTFFFGGNVSRTNIDVDATCARIRMTNNSHRSDGTAMNIAAGASEILVESPYFGAENDTQIVDGGATDFTFTARKKRFVQLGLAAAQSVPNSTTTTVIWSETHGSLGFSASPTSAIVVPANMGIRRVRVLAQTKWANNSTGVREVKISLNGAIVDGSGHKSKQATGLSHDQVEAVFDVADGDVIRVVVEQNSGVSLNFGPEEVFVRVEEY